MTALCRMLCAALAAASFPFAALAAASQAAQQRALVATFRRARPGAPQALLWGLTSRIPSNSQSDHISIV